MVSLRYVAAAAAAFLGTLALAQDDDDSSCQIMADMDLDGTDLTSTPHDNPTNCCGDCQATDGCVAYTWFEGTCYLKSDRGNAKDLEGAVSGTVGDTPPPSTVAPIDSCPSRVRKSWDALSSDEQATFVSALELAMDKGMYQKFVYIHQERMSNMEAHGTCVFLFWHRKYLLAFENMLRSFGREYECLTLPYWDYVQNYATMADSEPGQACASIEACSPVTTGLGGSIDGTPSSHSFFGASYPRNTCVPNRPLNHMCVHAGSGDCDHCVPRGDWAHTPMIADMSIDNIRSQLFHSASSIRSVSNAIELSPHNIMHGTLAGPMGNPLVSPMDPIFFMHHNTIDLLHTIFYHCQVEPLGDLSEDDLKSDTRVFEGCSTDNGDDLEATSPLLMRVGDSDNPVDVAEDPLVGAFFQDLPTQYYKLTDVRRLGYSFELKGLLGNLYSTCGDPNAAPQPERLGNATTVDHTVQPVTLKETLNVLAFEKDVLAQASRQHMTTDQGYAEIRKMTVMLHENCLPGSVQDFSDEFKTQWRIQGTVPSFAVLQAIQSGENPIRIANWTDYLFKYFGCRGDVKVID
ncbi:Aste57867_1533 [Aphanomyces stellatus]|uniref:Aste57867_1533 protein n=1 Tax=Aphanomyces stellatus TaxID=120398 RepID=A0A485K9M7_9STRA|nr:hypothetical protein As57867_001532 [Aphanomyces stellatus]VFT78748.1 Aste57867_1533 [Aphanomyces stellatus]